MNIKESQEFKTELRREKVRIFKDLVRGLDVLFPQWKPITSDSMWYGDVIAPLKLMIAIRLHIDTSKGQATSKEGSKAQRKYHA